MYVASVVWDPLTDPTWAAVAMRHHLYLYLYLRLYMYLSEWTYTLRNHSSHAHVCVTTCRQAASCSHAPPRAGK